MWWLDSCTYTIQHCYITLLQTMNRCLPIFYIHGNAHAFLFIYTWLCIQKWVSWFILFALFSYADTLQFIVQSNGNESESNGLLPFRKSRKICAAAEEKCFLLNGTTSDHRIQSKHRFLAHLKFDIMVACCPMHACIYPCHCQLHSLASCHFSVRIDLFALVYSFANLVTFNRVRMTQHIPCDALWKWHKCHPLKCSRMGAYCNDEPFGLIFLLNTRSENRHSKKVHSSFSMLKCHFSISIEHDKAGHHVCVLLHAI